ncbi:hypothetical protein QBC40DRAFT_302740 [Triangularia verruculosa]|uniref:Uncharacterized protein n=1 Tax=Triangularia verruculosa TaxID=2587418 RepID=A0AAN6XRI5_9PEZI|nr:hypothetical protein QBC40DRAFT_302740 [Triangularia verruculosa]
MAPRPDEADLTVGIDFGMTCTGVAVAKRHQESPRMIQEWPLPDQRSGTHNKVPSTLLYDHSHGDPTAWGFRCNNHEKTVDWFKRYLDEKYLQAMIKRAKETGEELEFETIEQVRKYFGDYMKCLYKHISQNLQKNEDWRDKRVEFVFSLPATFQSLEISDALMKEIKKAGFGTGGRKHNVSWGLSEPQAAAVYTAKDGDITLLTGDVILTCDAGGGTTDFALLEQCGDAEIVELKERAIVQGINIGSTNIDMAFARMVQERLNLAKADTKAGRSHLVFHKNAADTMMHSEEFQTWKHEFGNFSEAQFRTPRVTVPIRSGGTSSTSARITDGKMNFSYSDFQDLFDPQVEGIIHAMREMLQQGANAGVPRPRYFILSGGLGSSAYVQQKVREAFPAPIKVIAADGDEPPLAVAKGLVLDRKQKARHGRPVLGVRKARVSYGVVTQERYDPERHEEHERIQSGLDGEYVVENQIKWVIEKGQDIDTQEPIRYDGFSKAFSDRRHPGVSKRELVICHRDGNDLPTSKSDVDVFPLCTVKSDLSKVDKKHIHTRTRYVKRKVFGIPNLKKERQDYYEIDYDVCFVVGALDARFEMWIDDKQYADKNSFKIEWEERGLKSTPR